MQTQRQYSGTWQPEASPLHTNLTRLARAPIAYLPFAGKPFRDKKPALLLFPCEQYPYRTPYALPEIKERLQSSSQNWLEGPRAFLRLKGVYRYLQLYGYRHSQLVLRLEDAFKVYSPQAMPCCHSLPVIGYACIVATARRLRFVAIACQTQATRLQVHLSFAGSMALLLTPDTTRRCEPIVPIRSCACFMCS